ncbi:MAG: acyl carrier protein [Oscillospiraceae bacterium]|nr:acyl carrier protein [Oscillospiraceae bacterium]
MTNLKKYRAAFAEGLEIDGAQAEGASVGTVAAWDSITQMSLIAALEETFEIEIEPEDIVALNSWENGIEILKKYGIEV